MRTINSRILIVTALWGREDLTRVVLKYYQELQDNFAPIMESDTNQSDIDIQLLCVGSEGQVSRDLAQSYGWSYCEAPNVPLSQKFNALFEASEAFEYDLLVLVGSDDLLSPEIILWYAKNIRADHPEVVGLKDIFFYSIHLDELIHFQGYPLPSPRTIGAGRCFSREIMQRAQFRPWKDEKINRGLDSSCTAQLKKIGISEHAYLMSDLGGICVDVKDQMVSLTPWSRLVIQQPTTITEPESLMTPHFGPRMLGQLRELRKPSIFVTTENYMVTLIDPDHPLNGKTIEVSGEVAIDLLMKKKIAHP
jgi:hypothetical protein